MRTKSATIIAAFIFTALSQTAFVIAGACRCDHCGCNRGCQKVCRLVCEEKKVDVICWGCKCEDFCVPAPSTPGCRHCENICETCDAAGDCTKPRSQVKKFVWTDWTPSCAKIYTKKKLMQRVVSKKIPSYKWVVEDLCPECEANCPCAAIEPGAVVPPPPMIDAKLKYGEIKFTSLPAAAAAN
jgi:hypothetical protein